jgi:hypothetical protein
MRGGETSRSGREKGGDADALRSKAQPDAVKVQVELKHRSLECRGGHSASMEGEPSGTKIISKRPQ